MARFEPPLVVTFNSRICAGKPDGSPTEDFGDASLPKNVHTEILA